MDNSSPAGVGVHDPAGSVLGHAAVLFLPRGDVSVVSSSKGGRNHVVTKDSRREVK